MINLLPGPVPMLPEVVDALTRPPVNHRSDAFVDAAESVKEWFRRRTGAKDVALMMGTGTLANDAIAAHLSGFGVVVSNGEFGERLIAHAGRAGLNFAVSMDHWGQPLSLDDLPTEADWLWAVHCETSTGVINDIARLRAAADKIGARLVLDCVSSLGAVPVDLSGVHMASAVSGKALGAPAGIAVVLADAPVEAAAPPPLTLDLARYWHGVPTTFSSPLLAALMEACMAQDRDNYRRFAGGRDLRRKLQQAGFTLVGDHSAPHVITLAVNDSRHLAAEMRRRGFQIAWESAYLLARNWVQICFMGAPQPFNDDDLVAELRAARG